MESPSRNSPAFSVFRGPRCQTWKTDTSLLGRGFAEQPRRRWVCPRSHCLRQRITAGVMSDNPRTLVSSRKGSDADVDFRELRIKTRVEQGLPDGLPREVVDQVVQLTRLCARSAGARSEGPEYGMESVDGSEEADRVRPAPLAWSDHRG